MKLDIVKNAAKFIKETYPNISLRINSNGHGNLIHKRNIVPELVGLIDKISISLNAEKAELYAELSKPSYEKEIAYEAVKDFIAECVKNGLDTTVTVVTGFENYKIDVEKCREIAKNLGAKFRIPITPQFTRTFATSWATAAGTRSARGRAIAVGSRCCVSCIACPPRYLPKSGPSCGRARNLSASGRLSRRARGLRET